MLSSLFSRCCPSLFSGVKICDLASAIIEQKSEQLNGQSFGKT